MGHDAGPGAADRVHGRGQLAELRLGHTNRQPRKGQVRRRHRRVRQSADGHHRNGTGQVCDEGWRGLPQRSGRSCGGTFDRWTLIIALAKSCSTLGGIMTRWHSIAALTLAALVAPAALSAQQEPLRNVIPKNTWKDWTQPAAPTGPIAVRAGRLFDSKSGQMLTRQVVLIQDERITDVGPEGRVSIPAGARVIDLSQATVLPGFIDGHSHVFESAPEKGQTAVDTGLIAAARAYDCIIAGFTTMRDAGSHGNGNGDVAVRNAIDRGDVIGPRLSVATEGIRFAANQPRGPEAARAMVRKQIQDGATHIKIYPTGGYSFTHDGQLQVQAALAADGLN